MVDDPVRLPLEQGGAGVDENRSLLDYGLVTLLRVFPGSVEEEATANCHPHLVVV